MRIFSASLTLLLASCGTPQADNIVAAAPEADRIECAAADGQMKRDCIVEQDGNTLTVRRSDGSFRRFALDEAAGVATADGADPGNSTALPDDRIEVNIDGETFRLPVK
jgi:hypothetical protein